MRILLITIIWFVPVFGISQVIGNSMNGDNSTLVPNGAVSFNTLDGQLGASYLKYIDSTSKAKNFIFGANLSAKNNGGLANIFNSGAFTPEGKINSTFGYSWKYESQERKKIIDMLSELELKVYNLQRYRDSLIFDLIDKDKQLTENKEIKPLFDSLRKRLDEQMSDIPGKVNKCFDPKGDKSHKDSVAALLKDSLCKIYDEEGEKVITAKKELEAYESNIDTHHHTFKTRYWNHRFTIYSNFGMSALAFKEYSARDTVNLSNNFTSRQFEGANVSLGFNYNLGTLLIFGVNMGCRHWNSLDLMTDKEYTLRTTSGTGNSVLISEKKMTGYSGVYDEFNQTYLNLDLVIFIHDNYSAMKAVAKSKTDQSNPKLTKNIFGINPYFSFKASDKKTIYPNVANVGLNIFVFKPNGKFSGGIFVELPDIQNNLEKMQDNPNLRDPITRLSFGLVGKLSIGSLFAPNF